MNLQSINKMHSQPNIKLEHKLDHISEERRNGITLRRSKILEYIRENANVTISNIAKEFKLNETTVRDDIKSLVDSRSISKKYLGYKGANFNYSARKEGVYFVA